MIVPMEGAAKGSPLRVLVSTSKVRLPNWLSAVKAIYLDKAPLSCAPGPRPSLFAIVKDVNGTRLTFYQQDKNTFRETELVGLSGQAAEQIAVCNPQFADTNPEKQDAHEVALINPRGQVERWCPYSGLPLGKLTPFSKFGAKVRAATLAYACDGSLAVGSNQGHVAWLDFPRPQYDSTPINAKGGQRKPSRMLEAEHKVLPLEVYGRYPVRCLVPSCDRKVLLGITGEQTRFHLAVPIEGSPDVSLFEEAAPTEWFSACGHPSEAQTIAFGGLKGIVEIWNGTECKSLTTDLPLCRVAFLREDVLLVYCETGVQIWSVAGRSHTHQLILRWSPEEEFKVVAAKLFNSELYIFVAPRPKKAQEVPEDASTTAGA